MKPPKDTRSDKMGNEPSPSRLEEARRILEEYVQDLREIIKKLGQRLH